MSSNSITLLLFLCISFSGGTIQTQRELDSCNLDSKLFILAIQLIQSEFSTTNVNVIYNNRNDICEHVRQRFQLELWSITTGTVSFYDMSEKHTQQYDNEHLIGFHLHQFTPWIEVNLVLFFDGRLAAETVQEIIKLHHFKRANSFNIFWQLENRNENLLEIPVLEKLKYKIELIAKPIEHVPPVRRIQVEVWSRCFYCNDGNPYTQYLTSVEVTSTGFITSPSKHDLFKDYTHDFYGRTLQVALTKGMPEMMSFKRLRHGRAVVTGGFQGKLFLLVRRKLNFAYNITVESTFGVKGQDGLYTGMVGAVQSGRAALGIGATATPGRHKVVHFLTPNTFELVTFITGQPQPRPEWQMIFLAFALPLWFTLLCIACLMVYPTFVIANTLAERANIPKLFHIGVNGVGFIFRSIFDQAWSKDRSFQYPAVRILAAAWLLAALFIGTEVKCNLMKLAVSPPMDPVPTTFTQLADSDYDIITHYAGGSLNRILSTTHTPTFDKITQKMRQEKSIRKCLEEAVKSHAACISYEDDAIMEGQRNFSDPYGHLHIHKAVMSAFNFYASIILPKDAVYIESMESIVSQIVDMGLVKRFHDEQYTKFELKGRRWARMRKRQYINNATDEDPIPNKMPLYYDVKNHHYEKLTIKHFLAPFIVLTFGFGAALVARVVESYKATKVKVESFELDEQHIETAEDTRGLVSGYSRRRRSSVSAAIPYLLSEEQ